MNNSAEKNNENLTQQLTDVLQQRFKLAEFRPGQLQAIESLLTKKRLLCIQPTGHGKSLLYQLPSVLLPGMTIVISPLLALMRDQIQQLQFRFAISAGSINSDQDDNENSLVQHRANRGELSILFIAPEKLDRLDYRDFLLQLPISLLVIDEAHCISTWGHDFRPSYRQIVHFATDAQKQYQDLHLLALTATANAQTEQDIAQQLSVDDKEIIIQRQSMARPNIHLSAINVAGLAEKLVVCRQFIQQQQGIGLIYCATRENTEIVAEFLQQHDIKAVAYHAGLAADKKRELQQALLDDQYQVIVATNALGMGIDKQDLRYIIHFDVPGSITAYYQEVGRSGRDGKPAQGILLFDQQDKKIQQYFIDSAQPQAEDFALVQDFIRQTELLPNLTEIKRGTGLHPTRLQVVMAECVEQGFIEKKLVNRRQVYRLTDKQGEIDLSRYQRQLQVREDELQAMLHYANSSDGCLMQLLRQALGDTEADTCGNCAICQPSPSTLSNNNTEVQQTTTWLNQRTVSINLGRVNEGVDGIALLDGKVRSAAFIHFMKSRMQATDTIDKNLQQLLLAKLKQLRQQYQFTAVIAIPSRTWQGQALYADVIARQLQVPYLSNYLLWQTAPEARQGELLNNDQRRYNVANKMKYQKNKKLPKGSILLLDDYIGSGATMKEAIRVLRKQARIHNIIVPFTIASVRWRLGKRGMI